MTLERLLSPNEVGVILGVCRERVRQFARDGLLRVAAVAGLGRRLYAIGDVLAFKALRDAESE